MEVKRFTSLRQTVTPEMQDQKLKEVAQLYEKQFLREMVKSMRSTVHESGFIKSNQAEQIFKEQLDHEYVEKWGQKGGIGLADMIYNQLLDKYGEALGIRRLDHPKGPIQFSEKDKIILKDSQKQVRANNPIIPLSQNENNKTAAEVFSSAANEAKSNKMDSRFEFQSLNGFQNREVTSPWPGEIKKMYSLDVENHFMEIFHKDLGFSSELHFKGINSLQSNGLKEGDPVLAGQRLGLLSPEARRLFWNINPTEVVGQSEISKNKVIE